VNLDALTYAGNLENLKDIEGAPNYIFERANILDTEALHGLFKKYNPDGVIHLAAESHVDRSITSPLDFVYTNVVGTVNLLNAAKRHGMAVSKATFLPHLHRRSVGALGDTGLFTETTTYDPNSPYSASKAASDHFVRAYGETYHLPVVVTNCSNNYGPNHFPES
jgi:dTDP-glucose 4,6-dehydratase